MTDPCPHDLAERESSCYADGLCPLCMVEELTRLRMESREILAASRLTIAFAEHERDEARTEYSLLVSQAARLERERDEERTESARAFATAAAALAERDDLQRTFDLRWKADMRAIKMWQAAGKGRELTWPDHADLVVWLMDELDKAKEKIFHLRLDVPDEP